MQLTRRAFTRRLATSAALSLLSSTGLCLPGDEVDSPVTPNVLDIQRGRDRLLLDINAPAGRAGAAWLLRDISAGYVGNPHPNLLRLLAWVQAVIAAHGSHEVFVITSGARLPRTNARTEGASDNSRHIPDQAGLFSAADLQPTRFTLATIADVLATAKYGGVGLYPSHIHADFGRVARWSKENPAHR